MKYVISMLLITFVFQKQMQKDRKNIFCTSRSDFRCAPLFFAESFGSHHQIGNMFERKSKRQTRLLRFHSL